VVAHSAGAIVAPHLVAELGDVRRLVMVAGMCAPHGECPIDIVDPNRELGFEENREALIERWRGHTFVDAADSTPPNGLLALRDARVVQMLDSIVTMYQPVSWSGVTDRTGRTWVRCARDRVQPPDMQDRLIAACAADEVRTIDTGHSPAREDPPTLAALIDALAE
jgi:pimeloyl-ACP methyl ester carboxylesterase